MTLLHRAEGLPRSKEYQEGLHYSTQPHIRAQPPVPQTNVTQHRLAETGTDMGMEIICMAWQITFQEENYWDYPKVNSGTLEYTGLQLLSCIRLSGSFWSYRKSVPFHFDSYYQAPPLLIFQNTFLFCLFLRLYLQFLSFFSFCKTITDKVLSSGHQAPPPKCGFIIRVASSSQHTSLGIPRDQDSFMLLRSPATLARASSQFCTPVSQPLPPLPPNAQPFPAGPCTALTDFSRLLPSLSTSP